MNIQTYLMIKSAYYDGMEKDATSMEQKMRSDQKRKDMKALDRAAKKGIRGPATEEAIQRQPNRAAQLGVSSIDSAAPTDFITSESVSSPMYTDTVNVDDSFDSSNSPISDMQNELEDTRRALIQAEHNAQGHLYNNTRSQEIGNRTYDVAHRLADRGLKSYQYGGAGIGGAAGAGLGYAGSKWLAKKLGLKGRKALAVKLLGTAGLGAAGAYGGYRLGDYTGKKVFNTHGAGRFPDLGFQGVEVD